MRARVPSALLLVLSVCSVASPCIGQISEVTEEDIKKLTPIEQREVRGCCSELLTGVNANTEWGCSHYKVEQVCTAEQIEEARKEGASDPEKSDNKALPSQGSGDNSVGKTDQDRRDVSPDSETRKRSTAPASCNREEQLYLDSAKEHKELSNELNDQLLKLAELQEENNRLVEGARRSLGVRLIGHLISLPLSWAGNLYNVVQAYLGNEFSDVAVKSADRFMQARKALQIKIQQTKDEFGNIKTKVEQAHSARERFNHLLHECRQGKN